jgi:glycosyltransferase involved in cell wall biosynthesis
MNNEKISMKISVIFSTYNSPDWMEKVLWGFYYQSYQDFELIIADDGSNNETKERITKFVMESGLEVKHVWQQDQGFQKTKILNKALLASTGEYILFTDGDCIPRKDFLQVHYERSETGYFLSGGYFKLPMETSLSIDKQIIESGLAFDSSWLVEHGLKKTHKLMKLTASGLKQYLLNTLTLTKAT